MSRMRRLYCVVFRNKQLDEGAGRQNWKCHDPLNCVAAHDLPALSRA